MDDTSTVMPVQPMNYGYPMMGGYGYGNSLFGGDWSALIIIFLFAMMGGWGNGGWGGGFGGWGLGNEITFPWLLNGQNGINQNTDAAVNQLATQTTLGNLSTAVTAGFGDTALGIAGINQNICSTGNGITAAVTGAQNALTQQMYTNEIASLNRSFAEQTANSSGFNALQNQFATCCCDNKLSTVQTQNVVQSEAAATRAAIASDTQAILDKLCQQEIEAKNETIANLRTQVNMQNLAASQAAQTAALIADNTSQTQYIVNRVAPYPIPAYAVSAPYGYGYGFGGYGFNNGFGNVGFGNGSF